MCTGAVNVPRSPLPLPPPFSVPLLGELMTLMRLEPRRFTDFCTAVPLINFHALLKLLVSHSLSAPPSLSLLPSTRSIIRQYFLEECQPDCSSPWTPSSSKPSVFSHPLPSLNHIHLLYLPPVPHPSPVIQTHVVCNHPLMSKVRPKEKFSAAERWAISP